MIRCIIGVLILLSSSAALADPILLLLLRVARDRAVTASIEAGVNNLRQQGQTIPSYAYGFALPTPAIPSGTEEQQLRSLLDENFLHLTAGQRNEVFAGMQKILSDPGNAHDKARLLGEFALKAREVREAYRGLDALPSAEKRSLVMQAKEEYRRLPDDERQQLLDILHSGALPLPRDLRDSMLAEFDSIAPAGGVTQRRRE